MVLGVSEVDMLIQLLCVQRMIEPPRKDVLPDCDRIFHWRKVHTVDSSLDVSYANTLLSACLL